MIRPTETKGIAMGVVKFLTAMGLFIGQSPEFFHFMAELATRPTMPAEDQLELLF